MRNSWHSGKKPKRPRGINCIRIQTTNNNRGLARARSYPETRTGRLVIDPPDI